MIGLIWNLPYNANQLPLASNYRVVITHWSDLNGMFSHVTNYPLDFDVYVCHEVAWLLFPCWYSCAHHWLRSSYSLFFSLLLCSLKSQVRYLQYIKVSLSQPLQESKEFVHISSVHTPEWSSNRNNTERLL